jgi:hypothetical protein
MIRVAQALVISAACSPAATLQPGRIFFGTQSIRSITRPALRKVTVTHAERFDCDHDLNAVSSNYI